MTKTKLMRKIVNCQTGEITEREFNGDEYSQKEIDAANYLQRKTEAEAKAIAKAAILERLGLTEDEAKLLLN